MDRQRGGELQEEYNQDGGDGNDGGDVEGEGVNGRSNEDAPGSGRGATGLAEATATAVPVRERRTRSGPCATGLAR